MIFGNQRLIGVSDWTNVRRTFDAFLGTFAMPGNTLDVFYARPMLPAKYRSDNDVPGTDIAGGDRRNCSPNTFDQLPRQIAAFSRIAPLLKSL